MNGDAILYGISVWAIPVILAITFHEAAHGFVAHKLGDDTAFRLGRVSANPLRHIDPFGTILLPALLLLTRSPFLFGYAKPVPVNFGALNNPKRDMIWVAAAGPAANIVMAFAAGFAAHALPLLPAGVDRWAAVNLGNMIEINVLLAVFNMIPLPPLDGGRVAVGLLPRSLAIPFARLERFGMLILIFLLLVLPSINPSLNLIGRVLVGPATFLETLIYQLTGHGS
ncbi:MAG TPA: site-2 protease family protein [Stellaceae bacterium]|nr:site-2 protease family protein [Stellaceae bacterium]